MPPRDSRPWVPILLLCGLVLAGAAALLVGPRFFGGVRVETSVQPPVVPNSTATPPRIVAFSPALAIILRDLGLEDRIVGRHGYDMILDPAIPVCGEQSSVDYERLISVAPTHVLVQWNERDVPQKLKDLAAARGWKLINAPALKLDEIRQTVARLAKEFSPADPETGVQKADLIGTDPRSLPAYLKLRDQMDRVWGSNQTPTSGDPSSPRVLLLASLDPPRALGPGSFHHELLLAVGGRPAIAEGDPYITLDAEDVLRLAPEAIVIFAPRPPRSQPPERAPTGDELIASMGRLGTLDLPAVRARHVALIDDPLCQTPSTALIGIGEQLRGIVAAWRTLPGP